MRKGRRAREGARDDGTTVSVTCAVDGRAHRVPDLQLGAAGTGVDGRFRALCGHVVTAASLAEPDGAACPACGAL